MKDKSQSNQFRAEFDHLADSYYRQHKENIAITGEEPEYFSRYKVADLSQFLGDDLPRGSVLDFGCGIGNSIEHFREIFPVSELHCADVSVRSIEIARSRFPGAEHFLLIDEDIPLPDESIDVAFAACVFHHIPHQDHRKWLGELKRVVRPGGVLAVYEHNPLNPLTVRAVNSCPLDVNAKLIRAREMMDKAMQAGWVQPKLEYKIFFPTALRYLRRFEIYMKWCALGAQWRLTVIKQAY